MLYSVARVGRTKLNPGHDPFPASDAIVIGSHPGTSRRKPLTSGRFPTTSTRSSVFHVSESRDALAPNHQSPAAVFTHDAKATSAI